MLIDSGRVSDAMDEMSRYVAVRSGNRAHYEDIIAAYVPSGWLDPETLVWSGPRRLTPTGPTGPAAGCSP